MTTEALLEELKSRLAIVQQDNQPDFLFRQVLKKGKKSVKIEVDFSKDEDYFLCAITEETQTDNPLFWNHRYVNAIYYSAFDVVQWLETVFFAYSAPIVL